MSLGSKQPLYRVHKSQPVDPIMSQLSPTHMAPTPLRTTALRCGVASRRTYSKTGGPPLVSCPRLFIRHIPNFLLPHSQDAPCRCDKRRDNLQSLFTTQHTACLKIRNRHQKPLALTGSELRRNGTVKFKNFQLSQN